MINPSSIALGELIAAGGYLKPQPFIQGLNEVSFGGVEIQPEYFQSQVIEAAQEGAHTDVLDATSSRLAEIIRDTMDTVKTHGVPLAKAIAENTSILYSPDRLRGLAVDRFDVTFVNVDDPFFDSPLFPTVAPDTTMAYNNVSLEMIKGLQFNYPTLDQIAALVTTNHPDVRAIMDNPDCSNDFSANLLTDRYELKECFVCNEMNFDFQQLKCVDVSRLLKAYVILIQLKHSDEPAPWMTTGSLEDYRAYINLLFNGMTIYLLNLKKIVLNFRAQGLVISHKEAPLMNREHDLLKKVRMIGGSLKVYYTDKLLGLLTAENISFKEALIGMYYGRLTDRSMTVQDFLTNPGQAASYARDYFANINADMIAESRKHFIAKALEAIVEFSQADEGRRGRVEDNMARGQSMADWAYKTFYDALENTYSAIAVSREDGGVGSCISVEGSTADVGIDDRTSAILSTPLVVTYLRAINCTLAANLIADTFILSNEDNVGDQRQRMSVAIINLIVNMALE